VPNSFTPDGNNRNESFQAIFTAGYDRRTFELFIFNQWGETMFVSYNENVGWDGTYIWKIRFRLLDDSEFKEYFRHVNVLR
jgi:gliding motility-associated-like protein